MYLQACFSGGMFALGAQYATKPDMTMQMGKDITESCREMYHRSGKIAVPLHHC